jgi:hypothetical protein
MWKLMVGFIAFAAIVMFVMVKAGAAIDMSGEKHSGDAMHAPAQTQGGELT